MKTLKEQTFPETATDTFWEPWEFVSFTDFHTMKETNFKMLIEPTVLPATDAWNSSD